MKELIQKLVEAQGPSGYEQQVRDIIRAEVEGHADEVRVDPLGSLIVRKGSGGQGGKTIMLADHMDELGVMATHIDDKGFVRFATLGGIYRHTLIGGRVRFLNGSRGVIGTEHPLEREKLPAFDRMFIDVG